MLVVPSLRTTLSFARQSVRRNLGVSAWAAQKASDPIQQLFVDKVQANLGN